MKKIEKVSIANISFTLDNDAYLSLKQYLDSLHKYYDKDPDGGEITRDIEARIAELILSEQVYTKVVGRQLIDTIVAQLGTPQEIDDIGAESDSATGQSVPDASIPRRLYRIAEGRVFGGVCSGMAHYWNSSVAWFRLGFLAPFILFLITAPFDWDGASDLFLGLTWVFFVVYVVLWIAIPIAKTPRQKLEARGEKITPSSIRQNLQQSATTPGSKKAASVGAEVLTVLGRVVLFLIKLVVAVIAFGLIIGALAMLAAMIIIPFSAVHDPTLDWLGNTPVVLLIAELAISSVMIPCFVIGMALLSLAFNRKLGRMFYIITLGIWSLIVIAITIIGVINVKNDKVRETIRSEVIFHRNKINSWENRIEQLSGAGLFDEDYDHSDEKRLLRNFLDRESTGEITVFAAGDSVVITARREVSTDSLSVASGEELQYNKRIVLRDPDAVEEALSLGGDDKKAKSITVQIQADVN
jgi:phage shock protein PspC (stress-responsive transcriptional regulator)